MGDPLLRIARHPVREMKKVAGPMIRSAIRTSGTSIFKRSGSLAAVTALIGKTARQERFPGKGPLTTLRKRLKASIGRLEALETSIATAVDALYARAAATEERAL